jgi:hypothetical protein
MAEDKKFTTDGVVLRGPASFGSDGLLTDVDMGIFINDKGDLVFRDNFIKNVLKKDALTLREIYNKSKGVFVELVPDPADATKTIEKLYFKDGTVNKAYSLEEIVNLCQSARRSLITGPLWWVGRTEIDHSECANITLETEKNNPDAPYILWSLDRYLADVTNTKSCDSLSPMTFYEKTINPTTGEWLWWDVQNLEIVVPPISDPYKLAMLLAKLSYQSYNSEEPVIFRLYDATVGKELTRTAVMQANKGKVLSPITLSYFGNLFDTNNTNSTTSSCSTNDCSCTTVDCFSGDGNCFVPNNKYVAERYAAQSHIIKVQFHVINYQPNHWERILGAAYGNETVTKSSIETVIFDINPSSRISRKHGTAEISNAESINIVFDNSFATSAYSVQLTPNKNAKVWVTNKSDSGFTINCSKKLTCSVDWTAILLNK